MSSAHGKLDIAPTESETTRTVGNFSRGSREAQAASVSHEADRSEKAKSLKSDMHAVGESDSSIVPKKPANNDGPMASAELVEGRGLTKENAGQSLLDRTQRRIPRSRGRLGVRVAAQRDGVPFIRNHPRQEPYAVVPHVRICARGGPQGPALSRY